MARQVSSMCTHRQIGTVAGCVPSLNCPENGRESLCLPSMAGVCYSQFWEGIRKRELPVECSEENQESRGMAHGGGDRGNGEMRSQGATGRVVLCHQEPVTDPLLEEVRVLTLFAGCLVARLAQCTSKLEFHSSNRGVTWGHIARHILRAPPTPNPLRHTL